MISERDIARLLGPRTDDNIPIQLEKTMPFRFNLLAVLLTFTGVAIADSYVIENINVVPMTEETVLGEHSVLVVDDKVVKICKQARDCRRSEVQRINGTGKYLIPGLTDMHAHTDPGLLPQNSPRALADLARRVQQQQLRQYVAFGVTTVHDVGGGPTTLRIR